MTYLEQKRLEAQRHYQYDVEYLRQNKDELDRMIKAEQDAMAREMPSTFWGAAQVMLTGGPPPPGQTAVAPGSAETGSGTKA